MATYSEEVDLNYWNNFIEENYPDIKETIVILKTASIKEQSETMLKQLQAFKSIITDEDITKENEYWKKMFLYEDEDAKNWANYLKTTE